MECENQNVHEFKLRKFGKIYLKNSQDRRLIYIHLIGISNMDREWADMLNKLSAVKNCIEALNHIAALTSMYSNLLDDKGGIS